MKRKGLALILAVMMIAALALPAQARETINSPLSEEWVRIRYAGNGRYLDVPCEGFYKDGTQLQIWDYSEGNQNQIFHLSYTGEGWQIFTNLTKRIVEVRNSSHKDYAEVAQWEKHNLACGKWDIIQNKDGTVSFKNRESGLYLNVKGGGDAKNGTKIVQYHNDGTAAMKFYLERLSVQDVISASYSRNLQDKDISWTSFNDVKNYVVTNETGMTYKNGDVYYYPTPYQGKIFLRTDYLPADTVKKLLEGKTYDSKVWEEIEKGAHGELTESEVTKLYTKLGFSSIPDSRHAISIFQVLLDSKNPTSNAWQKFLKAAKQDANGNCSGVIVDQYKEIFQEFVWGPLNKEKTSWGNICYIKENTYAEYASWQNTGHSEIFTTPMLGIYSGTWNYYFR